MPAPGIPSLRFTTAAFLALSACAQPHEIDLAARPTLLPDAVVKVWTRDTTIEITAVRMTDDSIFGRPITNKLHDPHTVGFALKQVSRLVVTQQPGAAGVATQSAILIGLGALVLAFFAAVGRLRHEVWRGSRALPATAYRCRRPLRAGFARLFRLLRGPTPFGNQ